MDLLHVAQVRNVKVGDIELLFCPVRRFQLDTTLNQVLQLSEHCRTVHIEIRSALVASPELFDQLPVW